MTLCGSNKKISAVLAVVILLLLAAASSAQAAGPVWSLQLTHSPSPFERLQEHSNYTVEYVVGVENSGTTTTTGNYTVSDTPPSQLAMKSVIPGPGWSCTGTAEVIAGMSLSCSTDEPLAPGVGTTAVRVLMSMSPSAPDTVTNEATISGGGAVAGAAASDPTPVVDRPAFNVEGFTARSTDAANVEDTLAGGHPYQAATRFSWPTYRGGIPVEDLKDVFVELPSGFLGNPAAAPRCPMASLEPFFPTCPAASIVGFAEIGQDGNPGNPTPIYNVVPERGYPAQFAFKVITAVVSLFPKLRSRTGDYGLTVGSFNADILNITSVATTFYGVPSLQNGSGGPQIPFLSNPVDCSQGPQTSTLAIDSWVHPGAALPDGSPDLADKNWKTATVLSPAGTECGSAALASEFQPSIEALPVQEGGPLQADQPSGLTVKLDFPQTNDPTNPSTIFDPSLPQAPELKDATVTLPRGVSISPSAADGLEGCSDSSEDPAGDQVHYDTAEPVTCPDASKIGTVVATTPLLAEHDPVTDTVTGPEPVDGEVYLLKPHPGDLSPGGGQDGTFRVLIQFESAANGINLKLPGVVKANAQTGQLTATFDANPQLPVSHLEINFKSGRRAPLATPVTCGTFTTTSDLKPWSAPETPDATPSSSFAITSGPNGAPCVGTPAAQPFNPTLSAGTESAGAGKFSPFVLHLARNDGEQEISSLDLTMPKGFSARLAGVPYCPEADIAAAEGKSGEAEQASPSCPSASQVGSVTVAAGPGTNPFNVAGKVYLAGPYKGASLSLVFITPAVAGPFDLGNVVVRAAVSIDPHTAQVTVKSDTIPQMLDGVPLQVRRIDLRVDRDAFTLNPTNCTPTTINGTVNGGSQGEASKSMQTLFQAADCADLSFKPGFAASTEGKTSRANGASLKVKLVLPAGGPQPTGRQTEANIAKVKVELPKALPSRLTTLQKACLAQVFAVNPAACPAGSVVGTGKAITPILPVPLEGPAYFVSNGGEAFPNLVVVLQGYGITVELVGDTSISKAGITSSTFDSVPDVPVSSFELTLPQGKFSALAANGSLCSQKLAMPTYFTAQDGSEIHKSTTIEATGCATRLSVAAKAIKQKTLSLSVYVPAAGKLTASGKGLSRASKSAAARGIVSLALKRTKSGQLKTKVKLSFVPKHGKKQVKDLAVKFK